MKKRRVISIGFKVVFLGALLSIITSSLALVISITSYRASSHKSLNALIQNTIEEYEDSLNRSIIGGRTSTFVKEMEDRFMNIYKVTDTSSFVYETFEEKEACYSRIDGMQFLYNNSIFGLSEDMAEFKNYYFDLTNYLLDASITSGATSSYIATRVEDNKMIFLADSRFIKKGGFYNLPLSEYSFNQKDEVINPTNPTDHYVVNYDNKTTYAINIYEDPNIENPVYIATLFIEYDCSLVDKAAEDEFALLIITLSITAVVLVLIYALGARLMFVKNITKLDKASKDFTDNLVSSSTIEIIDPNIKSRDELEGLSNSVVSMEKEIIKYIDVIKKETQEKERLNAELNIASKIQLDALPNNKYLDHHISLKAYIRPAKEVGGDFYDYFYLDNNHFVFLISDVSGKGVPASLFMMKAKELLKSKISAYKSLEKAVYEVNNELNINNEENLFVTSFIGIIDLEKEELKYINAGHEKPYILSNGELIKIEGASNFVLGGVEDFEYKQETRPFKKGERIFCFTDGLNESINSKNEEFSYSRIEDTLKENINSNLEEQEKLMLHRLDEFVKEKEQFDDITILSLNLLDTDLHLEYKERNIMIIEEILNKFNDKYSFIKEDKKSEINIIIDELVNNIISYEIADKLIFSVDFKIIDDELHIHFQSNGKEFNAFDNSKESNYIEEYKDDLAIGGFGIELVKNLSTSYLYEYKNKKNNLYITKKIS